MRSGVGDDRVDRRDTDDEGKEGRGDVSLNVGDGDLVF